MISRLFGCAVLCAVLHCTHAATYYSQVVLNDKCTGGYEMMLKYENGQEAKLDLQSAFFKNLGGELSSFLDQLSVTPTLTPETGKLSVQTALGELQAAKGACGTLTVPFFGYTVALNNVASYTALTPAATPVPELSSLGSELQSAEVSLTDMSFAIGFGESCKPMQIPRYQQGKCMKVSDFVALGGQEVALLKNIGDDLLYMSVRCHANGLVVITSSKSDCSRTSTFGSGEKALQASIPYKYPVINGACQINWLGSNTSANAASKMSMHFPIYTSIGSCAAVETPVPVTIASPTPIPETLVPATEAPGTPPTDAPDTPATTAPSTPVPQTVAPETPAMTAPSTLVPQTVAPATPATTAPITPVPLTDATETPATTAPSTPVPPTVVPETPATTAPITPVPPTDATETPPTTAPETLVPTTASDTVTPVPATTAPAQTAPPTPMPSVNMHAVYYSRVVLGATCASGLEVMLSYRNNTPEHLDLDSPFFVQYKSPISQIETTTILIGTSISLKISLLAQPLHAAKGECGGISIGGDFSFSLRNIDTFDELTPAATPVPDFSSLGSELQGTEVSLTDLAVGVGFGETCKPMQIPRYQQGKCMKVSDFVALGGMELALLNDYPDLPMYMSVRCHENGLALKMSGRADYPDLGRLDALEAEFLYNYPVLNGGNCQLWWFSVNTSTEKSSDMQIHIPMWLASGSCSAVVAPTPQPSPPPATAEPAPATSESPVVPNTPTPAPATPTSPIPDTAMPAPVRTDAPRTTPNPIRTEVPTGNRTDDPENSDEVDNWNITDVPATTQSPERAAAEGEDSLAFWLILVIIGGGLFVAGTVCFVVFRMRRPAESAQNRHFPLDNCSEADHRELDMQDGDEGNYHDMIIE